MRILQGFSKRETTTWGLGRRDEEDSPNIGESYGTGKGK